MSSLTTSTLASGLGVGVGNNNINTSSNNNSIMSNVSYTINNKMSIFNIKQILMRNLKLPNINTPIDCYITLHDINLKPIYISNIIKNTINPSFTLDLNNIQFYLLNNCNNNININTSNYDDLSNKKFILRLWNILKNNINLPENELFDILNHKQRSLSTVPSCIKTSDSDKIDQQDEFNLSNSILNDMYRNSLHHPHMPCSPCNSMPIITPLPNSLKAAKLVNLYDKKSVDTPFKEKCIYEMNIDLDFLNIYPPTNLNELIDIGSDTVVFIYNDGRMSFFQLSSNVFVLCGIYSYFILVRCFFYQ